MKTLVPKKLKINDIVPYWRNPRNATDADIAKIMQSIQEYGYVNWIIVDHDNVIITGHTRYLALRRLGFTELDVYESDIGPNEAKEYRIIDNRSAEFTQWDREGLLREVGELTETSVIPAFFPELDLSTGEVDLSHGVPELRPDVPETPGASKIATCVHCYHQWELSDDDVVKETA